MQKNLRWIALCLLLTGCAFPGVFKINIDQGNIITQEQLDQLKPGLTRRQVHFILGNPLIVDSFNSNHETYVQTQQIAGGDINKQRLTIFYEDDTYTHYESTLELDSGAETYEISN